MERRNGGYAAGIRYCTIPNVCGSDNTKFYRVAEIVNYLNLDPECPTEMLIFEICAKFGTE